MEFGRDCKRRRTQTQTQRTPSGEERHTYQDRQKEWTRDTKLHPAPCTRRWPAQPRPTPSPPGLRSPTRAAQESRLRGELPLHLSTPPLIKTGLLSELSSWDSTKIFSSIYPPFYQSPSTSDSTSPDPHQSTLQYSVLSNQSPSSRRSLSKLIFGRRSSCSHVKLTQHEDGGHHDICSLGRTPSWSRYFYIQT